MKVLENIKSEHIISVDIETCRVKEHYEDLDEGTKSAWQYKNKQDGVVPDFEELKSLWTKNSSLYAEFSKVCAVSLAFLHEGKLYCKEFYGENELELLEALNTTLNNVVNKSKDFRLAGHASKYFDYPFLSKRYVINNLDIPNIIDNTANKPWEGKNLCTNELWKVGGTGAGSSLQALCNVLDIPISKVDLVGDEVGESYYRGEYERIGRYCSLDTIATFNIIRKLKREPIFQFDEVVYVNANSKTAQKQEEEIFTKAHILERINNAPSITDEEKTEIVKMLSKKKVTKKDAPYIREILEKIYISNVMFKADSVPMALRKKEEIDEILKQIQNG